MCFPFSISATCCSATTTSPSAEMSQTSFTFSKVVLTNEQAKHYQIPWEKQQHELQKKRARCVCWCCLCTCLCKPVHNHRRRRVTTCEVGQKRANCYKQLIDVIKPTCDQVRDWSTKFDQLMKDEGGRRLLALFLQQEHSEENLLFWNEVHALKTIAEPSDYTAKVKRIYMEFLQPMAEKEVNVSGGTRKKIEEGLHADDGVEVARDVYDVAQLQVYNLIHRQSYRRFLDSDLFNSIVQSTYGTTDQAT